MGQDDMGQRGRCFHGCERFEAASFPEVTGIADEQLFSGPGMSKYCFEG